MRVIKLVMCGVQTSHLHVILSESTLCVLPPLAHFHESELNSPICGQSISPKLSMNVAHHAKLTSCIVPPVTVQCSSNGSFQLCNRHRGLVPMHCGMRDELTEETLVLGFPWGLSQLQNGMTFQTWNKLQPW